MTIDNEDYFYRDEDEDDDEDWYEERVARTKELRNKYLSSETIEDRLSLISLIVDDLAEIDHDKERKAFNKDLREYTATLNGKIGDLERRNKYCGGILSFISSYFNAVGFLDQSDESPTAIMNMKRYAKSEGKKIYYDQMIEFFSEGSD